MLEKKNFYLTIHYNSMFAFYLNSNTTPQPTAPLEKNSYFYPYLNILKITLSKKKKYSQNNNHYNYAFMRLFANIQIEFFVFVFVLVFVLEEEVNGEHDSSNRVKFVPITFAYWARFFGPHC